MLHGKSMVSQHLPTERAVAADEDDVRRRFVHSVPACVCRHVGPIESMVFPASRDLSGMWNKWVKTGAVAEVSVRNCLPMTSFEDRRRDRAGATSSVIASVRLHLPHPFPAGIRRAR